MAVVGYCLGGWVAVLGGGRGLAVEGVSCGQVGTLGGGCWWCDCCRLVNVGFIGWGLVGLGIEMVRVLGEEVALSVQDLVCDGCCWVAVDRGSGKDLGGVWHGCGLVVGLRGGFMFRR